MISSKAWNWAVVTETLWSTPSEDVYYYLDRWLTNGFTTFLDLGCGLGRHALLFASKGFRTYGLELSEHAVSVVREKAAESEVDICVDQGDIHRLPYVDGQFECLLAYHVISHTDTQGIQGILQEIGRVLKPGGEFYITLCSKHSPSYKNGSNLVVDSNTIIKMEEPEIGIPHYYCDLEDVKTLLSDFEVLRVRHIEDIYENTSSCHYFIHGRR